MPNYADDQFNTIAEAIAHEQALLTALHKRKRVLELQAGKYGIDVPAYVVTELENVSAEIQTLNEHVQALEAAALTGTPQRHPATQPTPLGLPLDSIPTPAALPPGSRMPFAANPLFVGREDDLRALASTLAGGQTTVIAAATGLGGIGKTQLATELVHRYGQFFAGGVFWLSFADATAVPGEVAACGGPGAMDLPGFHALSPADQVARVRQEWQHATPRLLIFDNCEDEQLLAEWRPTSGGCRVLITARRGDWDATLGIHILALDVLPRAKSVELLCRFRPDLAADDRDLAAIADALGDLPLALHLAGSFLKQYRADTRPADYLDELRSATPIAHESLQGDEPALSPTNHERNVGRSFKLSYDKLHASNTIDALALALLARAACFAPGEPIPRALLLKTVELPDTAAQRKATRALKRLVNLGLLDVEAEDVPRLHRLMVAFVRAEHNDAEAQPAVEQVLIDTGFDLLGKGVPAPLSAIQAHLRHVADAARDRDDERAASLCTVMGRYLRLVGSYAATRPYFERALTIDEGRNEPNEQNIATRLNNLASLLQDQGDYTAARLLFEGALAIREQVLGPNHRYTATALNNLALLLKDQGDYVAARPLLERALAIYEQELGRNHRYTATALTNLAQLLRAQGDDATARPLLERALAIYEQELGSSHPHTATSLLTLAQLLRTQDDDATARPLLERALAIYEQTLGLNHPHTATALSNLAILLQSQGNNAAARPLLEHALSIYEQVLGPSHPTTATSLWWIATLLERTGDRDGARERLERAVAIFRDALGPSHPNSQRCERQLAALDQPKPDGA